MTNEEAKKILIANRMIGTFDLADAIDIAVKSIMSLTPDTIEVLREIRQKIEQEISHWNKRIESLKGDDLSIHNTKPLAIQENSVPIRNPKEIEYVRYSNRIDGLEKALEIIDTHIEEITNETDN